MKKTLSQLKLLWNNEKEYYRGQELGTGLHSFIRSCLESDQLFCLSESLLSTKPASRKNCYIHENKAKEGRQADFVIYIDQDIIIPLEIERYGNIEEGIQQLFNYQKDFDKHYGILTDGFTWRFYNNNIFREFILNQILEEPDIFLEFWNEYIKPESYYLSFFEPQGQLSLLKGFDLLTVESCRPIFFADITTLITSFGNKLQVEGYFLDLNKKEREKRIAEITYAYIIQFILYKTLVDNKFGDFTNEFESIVEAIHECLKVKQYGKILAIIEGISNTISKNVYRPFKEEQNFISQTLLNLLTKPKNELHEVSPWLDIFVFIKKYNFASIRNEIFGFVYENYLKVNYEEERRGQYYTDSSIVDFMLEQVGYDADEIKTRIENLHSDTLSLIDPSCGSGTFLYKATDKIVSSFGKLPNHNIENIENIITDNIFGLDIEEFPLYLAEMSILMRMLPLIINEKYNNPIEKKIKVFMTYDSIAEFMDTSIKDIQSSLKSSILKESEGQLPLFKKQLELDYPSYVRNKPDLEEMKLSVESYPTIPRRRFDYVIGNPPYMHYNACSKLLTFKWIKQKKVKLNNIYGINLHSVPGNPKKYRPNPNIYAFFLGLGLALLKDGGSLCYILPQTLLTAGDLDVIRYHLAKFTTICKIITFTGKMFIGRGLTQDKPIPTSSLILILKQSLPSQSNKVEILNYDGSDEEMVQVFANISSNKKINKKLIKQQELLDNLTNWKFIKMDETINGFCRLYRKCTDSLSAYYDHISATHNFGSKFYFDGGYSFKEDGLLDVPTDDNLYYGCPHLNKQFYSIKYMNGYLPNIRGKESKNSINLRQANQGYHLLDSKYKIVWSTKNAQRFHFTDQPVVWSNIRLSGVGSDNKEELLYLFALLNSKLTFSVLNYLIKLENEKDFLVPIKTIKEFIRIPTINIENVHLKHEIIDQINDMLAIENYVLSDFVDFSSILIQKFDDVKVEGDNLVLIHDNQATQLPIKGDIEHISGLIAKTFMATGLKLEERIISLSELRNLQVIDFEKQAKLKDYIDDLVFALYFNIPLKKVSLKNSDQIHETCSRSEYYHLMLFS